MGKSKQYLKISFYAIFTFFACTVIYKIFFDKTSINHFLSNVVHIFSPLIIGIVIAYFVNPLVGFIEKKLICKLKPFKNAHSKASRRLSVFLSFIFLFVLLYFLLNGVIPQISKSLGEIKDAIPYYYESLTNLISNLKINIGRESFSLDMTAIDNFFQKNLPTTPEKISVMVDKYLDDVLSITGSIVSGLFQFIIGVFIAIYLLVNKEYHLNYLKKIFITLLPKNSSESFFNTTKESNEIFLRFITGKILDSLIIGFMCFFILVILNIPYPTLISLIVFITNMIPFFGPLIGGAIGAIFLIATYPTKAILFIIVILVLQQFDGNYLGPKILGDWTGLNPLYVLLAVIIFGGIFGLVGMFLGVPLLAVIKNIFDKFIDKKYKRKTNHIQS